MVAKWMVELTSEPQTRNWPAGFFPRGFAYRPQAQGLADQVVAAGGTAKLTSAEAFRAKQLSGQPVADAAQAVLDKLGAAVQFFSSEAESAGRELAKFAERFSTDPLGALRWAEAAVDAAVEQRLCLEALGFLRGEVNPGYEGDRLACVVSEWSSSLANKALHQRWSSSSMMSNKVEEAERIVLAKMLDRLRRWA